MSPSRSPYDRFPYGLVSPVEVFARGSKRLWRRLLSCLSSWGWRAMLPTCFLDIMDDDVGSDGSSIGDVAPSHHPSQECAMMDAPEQPPVATESSRTHAPPGPQVETPRAHT